MEPPISFEADAVRDEQAKVLQRDPAVRRPKTCSAADGARAVRRRARIGDTPRAGLPRQKPTVAPDSHTETFVALKLSIDNWRWADVPFYLRTGKRLPKRVTEIAIQFRRAPFLLFRDTPVERLCAQPAGDPHPAGRRASRCASARRCPAPIDAPGQRGHGFHATPTTSARRRSTGYERLLYDCMIGDATLFQRADMVEAGWSVVTPILDVWKALPPRTFPNYAAGTWGPKEADDLLARDGRHWRTIE